MALQSVFQNSHLLLNILRFLPTRSALELCRAAAVDHECALARCLHEHAPFFELQMASILSPHSAWPTCLPAPAHFDEYVGYDFMMKHGGAGVDAIERAFWKLRARRDAALDQQETAEAAALSYQMVELREIVDDQCAGDTIFRQAANDSHKPALDYIEVSVRERRPGIVFIQAPPGAGKTHLSTTIINRAEEYGVPVNYRTFNSALSDEMQERMTTAHARKRVRTAHGAELAIYKRHPGGRHKRLVSQCEMREFFANMEPDADVVNAAMRMIQTHTMDGCVHAQELVTRSMDPSNADIPMTHGCYALYNSRCEHPVAATAPAYEVFVYDEAQDGKFEMLMQLRRAQESQNALIILLGDSLQRIWGDDANMFELRTLENVRTFELASSFRFSSSVARLHNFVALKMDPLHVPIRGLGPPVEVVRLGAFTDLLASQNIVVIAHSNSSLLWLGAKLVDAETAPRRRVYASSTFRDGLALLQREGESLDSESWACTAKKRNARAVSNALSLGSVGALKDCELGADGVRTLHLVTAHSCKGAEYKNCTVYTHGDVLHDFVAPQVQLVAMTRCAGGPRSIQALHSKLADAFNVTKFL